MLKKSIVLLVLVFSVYIAGCATVPMASDEEDVARKEFAAPPQDSAGLYIYRNSTLGGALKKNVYVDGEFIGESAPKTYFYVVVKPGSHVLSTESEFSDNSLELHAESGQNYFIRQYIKFGVFVGGANLELVSEEEGKEGVLECKLAN
jgi:hypothetical protein